MVYGSFSTCATVLVLLIHLLLSVHTWADVILLASTLTTCTTSAVVCSGTPATAWSYVVVAGGAVLVYVLGLVSLLDVSLPLCLFVVSVLCGVRQKV